MYKIFFHFRVHKFVNDAKARLCNLSQKRKQLAHQKSVESYGLPSGRSTESLGKYIKVVIPLDILGDTLLFHLDFFPLLNP